MTVRGKTVSVIGLGYIGLPTAAILAARGYKVKGADNNALVVNMINTGETHIVEPGLDSYVQNAVACGDLKAYPEVQEADIYIICVPTPFEAHADTPTPDVSHVMDAARSICPKLKRGDIVILESTSPVGTTELVRNVFIDQGIDISSIHIAYCPERVLPGRVMVELVNNARVVGTLDTKSADIVEEFYRTFVDGEILKTEAKTAEMCKLTENSFRDVNIAFANELSLICENNGVDVWNLIKLANCHPRVNILQPSSGVGGHCIAVDPWFIVSQDPNNARLIRTAREVNDFKPKWVVEQIRARAEALNTKRIACLGLAFKPNIDDLRESPAVYVAEVLVDQGYDVYCVEPNIAEHEKFNLVSIEAALTEFEVIALLVSHEQFLEEPILPQLRSLRVLDFCGAVSR